MSRLPFLPKEDKFFVLFKNEVKNMVDVASEFNNMVQGNKDIVRSVAELTEMEHNGDTITHDIIAMLHTTFVTPFDREDIAALAQRMDDVVDLIHEATETMLTYEIENTTKASKDLADILIAQTRELEKAIPILEQHRKLKDVLPHCVEINRLENIADKVCRAALGELFKNPDDVVNIMKWREIYGYLETATDRCEDVANVLEGIALKHG